MVCRNPKSIYIPSKHPIYQFADYYETQFRKASMTPKRGYYEMKIPCRNCLGCALDHANDWAVRMYCEMQTQEIGCFITLTYSPENVPINENREMTLKKEDTQKFWHDLRQKHPELKISYVICGEYGTKATKRPHYHACVWGYEPKDLKYYKPSRADKNCKLYKSKEIYDIWGKGICIIGKIEYRSACYVARYVQKKAGLKHYDLKYDEIMVDNEKAPTMEEIAHYLHNYALPYKNKLTMKAIKKEFAKTRKRIKRVIIKEETNKEPQFICASNRPAIGLNYWKANKEKIKRNNGIFVNYGGHIKLKPIPTYFKKMWKEENPEEYYNWAYKNVINSQITLQNLISQLNLPSEYSQKQKEKYLRELTIETLKIKAQKGLKRTNFI